MGYQIKLDVFEGPFDLLLHLIEKAKVDIYAIPIAQITEEYLSYLSQMQKLDLEVTSEFLVIAATLIKLKSSMLLPKAPNNNEEPLEQDDELLKENLIAKLIEYKYFKEISIVLQQQEEKVSLLRFRPPMDIALQSTSKVDTLSTISLENLWNTFQRLLDNTSSGSKVDIQLLPEVLTIEEKMQETIRTLRQFKDYLSFSKLFPAHYNKEQVIVTFLAVLELMRQGEIIVLQTTNFSDIYLLYNQNG